MLITQAGLLYEHAGYDEEQRPQGKVMLNYTGGHVLSGLLSADVMNRQKAISLGIQVQLPLIQHQNADTQLATEGRARISLSKFF